MKKVFTLIVPIGFAFVAITSCNSNSMRNDAEKVVKNYCKEKEIKEKMANIEKEMSEKLIESGISGFGEEYERKVKEFEKQFKKEKGYEKLEEEYKKIKEEGNELEIEIIAKYTKEDKERLEQIVNILRGNCGETVEQNPLKKTGVAENP